MCHGTEGGLVALGGRQISIRRPRKRSADRSSEVQLPTYQACTSTELLGLETLVRMMATGKESQANIDSTARVTR